ncbi:MAG: hypothetical protein U0175_35535 [Caldilineaceae bacterium]
MFFTKNSSISHTHQHIQHLLDFLEASPMALGLLESTNFGAARLQEGRAILQGAQMAYANVQEQMRNQKAATVTFHELWNELRRIQKLHLNAVRSVLGSDALSLPNPRSEAYFNWLEQSRAFYKTILENADAQERLRQGGILVEAFVESYQKIEQVVARKNLQSQAVEALRLANQTSQQQQRALQQWVRELNLAAPLAFRQVPSLLAVLRPVAPRKSKKDTKVVATQTK